MATKKKTATKQVKGKQKNVQAVGMPSQFKAVLWFALAVFLMFVVFIKGENVWTHIHNFLFGIFGVTAYFYPILLGVVAIMFALDKGSGTLGAKVTETAVLAIFIGGAVDIFREHKPAETYWEHIKTAYTLGVAHKNGGFFGAFFGHPLFCIFGKAGAAVTIILLIFVFLMLITGTSLGALFKLLSRPVKAVSSQAENAYRERAEREEKREKADSKKESKFNVDIPIDEIPEKRERKRETLNEKQKKVVSTYYDEPLPQESEISSQAEKEQNESLIDDVNEDKTDDKVKLIKQALDIATAEYADVKPEEKEKPEKIKVDFEKETDEFAESIVEEKNEGYVFPSTSLLKTSNSNDSKTIASELDSTAERLVETLRSFGVETRIVDISRGPTVTRYELQPCAGVKISKITNLADDIALNLATAGVRIEAPIPNKAAVGIEVPNKASAVVGVRDIIESSAFTSSKSKLTVAMGRDIGGNVVVADIAKMPHGLIAGATGSGKSVCINSIIMSILYKATPEEVKMLMIDPKVVELGIYNGIPHLLVPVVTEPRKAAGALGWAVSEMEKRYQMFADRSVRDIEGYNRFVATLKDEPEVEKMPHIVIIIDELADLMMTAPNEVEDSINRIAAKARAAGMHLLIATQRPSVDVVTGVIKANIPSRIAFAVSSQIDSRTILDGAGAEKLLGRGDMLFSPIGSTKPKRVQGCFVSDEEVERVVEFVKTGKTPDYDDNIMVEIERQAAVEKQKKTGLPEDAPDEDPMLEEAISVVVEMGQASTSLLQRKLKLGYARAARIVDAMEERGVVGPYEGAKPRKVLITKEQLMERKAGEE